MTTNDALPPDISDAYFVGGYHALMAFKASIAYDLGTEPTLADVLDTLDGAMEIIITSAEEDGRDITPYLPTEEQMQKVLDS